MTSRQAEILTNLVRAYAETATPVGSLSLSQELGVSPATVRTELAELERSGYIRQPHTSAGRVPTDKGYRAYVNALQEGDLDGLVSRVIAKRVASSGEVESAVKAAVESLAELTHNLSLATLSGSLYTRGMASLFAQPEFFGSRQAYEVARLLDSLDEWLSEAVPSERISVYIGRENPIGKSSGCSLIISRFVSPYSDRSYIGVLGPTRQSYDQVIGLVSYTGKLLEEALN